MCIISDFAKILEDHPSNSLEFSPWDILGPSQTITISLPSHQKNPEHLQKSPKLIKKHLQKIWMENLSKNLQQIPRKSHENLPCQVLPRQRRRPTSAWRCCAPWAPWASTYARWTCPKRRSPGDVGGTPGRLMAREKMWENGGKSIWKIWKYGKNKGKPWEIYENMDKMGGTSMNTWKKHEEKLCEVLMKHWKHWHIWWNIIPTATSTFWDWLLCGLWGVFSHRVTPVGCLEHILGYARYAGDWFGEMTDQ